MLLVDEIDIDGAGVCHAKYQVKEDEFFCQGHFPGNPVVPGVIQCEIMAQSCALLVKDEIKGKTTLYTGIDNVRFKQICVRLLPSLKKEEDRCSFAKQSFLWQAIYAARASFHSPWYSLTSYVF